MEFKNLDKYVMIADISSYLQINSRTLLSIQHYWSGKVVKDTFPDYAYSWNSDQLWLIWSAQRITISMCVDFMTGDIDNNSSTGTRVVFDLFTKYCQQNVLNVAL